MLPTLLVAGTALDVYGKMKEGSAARRAADNRATALKTAARKRLAQGEQESALRLAQGGTTQTSEFASLLGRGVSREASVVGQSLNEIMNRAKFEAEQALTTSQEEAQAMIADAGTISQEGRTAQQMALLGSASSILGSGSSYLQGKYGKDAYSKF